MSNSGSLLAYAVFSSLSLGDADIISGLRPIFKYVALNSDGDVFDAKDFSKRLREAFGVDIHQWAIEGMAPKLERMGVISRQAGSPNNSPIYLYCERDKAAPVSGGSFEIVNRIRDSYSEYLSAGGFVADSDDMDDFVEHFFKFVSNLGINDLPGFQGGSGKMDVLAASFVLNAKEECEETYGLLKKVFEGAMLAEAVINVRNPQAKYSLKGVSIILDTPTFLEICDLSEKEKCEATSLFAAKLKELGAFFYLFPHTRAEIYEVLKATLSETEGGGGYGPLARRLKLEAAKKTVVRAAIGDMDALLSAHKVTEKSTNSVQFDVAEVARIMAELKPRDGKASAERDAKSILCLEKIDATPQNYAEFYKKKCLMVTKNSDLARVANMRKSKLSHAPSIMTERELATLLWLSFGGDFSGISHAFLISNCMSALDPSNALVDKVREFISGCSVQDAEMFEVLLNDRRAAQFLTLHAVGGDISSIATADGIAKLLADMRSSISQEAVSVLGGQHKKKMESLASRHEEEVLSIRDEARKEVAGLMEGHQHSMSEMNKKISDAQSAILDARASELEKSEELKEMQRRLEVMEEGQDSRNLQAAQRALFVCRILVSVSEFAFGAFLAFLGFLFLDDIFSESGLLTSLLGGFSAVGVFQFWLKGVRDGAVYWLYQRLSPLFGGESVVSNKSIDFDAVKRLEND